VIPHLLVDLSRTALTTNPAVSQSDGLEWCRVVGPLGRPYEFLFLMVFDEPNGRLRLQSEVCRRREAVSDCFVVIAELTAELGVPCLLVERTDI
jgi:hypothetical protein